MYCSHECETVGAVRPPYILQSRLCTPGEEDGRWWVGEDGGRLVLADQTECLEQAVDQAATLGRRRGLEGGGDGTAAGREHEDVYRNGQVECLGNHHHDLVVVGAEGQVEADLVALPGLVVVAHALEEAELDAVRTEVLSDHAPEFQVVLAAGDVVEFQADVRGGSIIADEADGGSRTDQARVHQAGDPDVDGVFGPELRDLEQHVDAVAVHHVRTTDDADQGGGLASRLPVDVELQVHPEDAGHVVGGDPDGLLCAVRRCREALASDRGDIDAGGGGVGSTGGGVHRDSSHQV